MKRGEAGYFCLLDMSRPRTVEGTRVYLPSPRGPLSTSLFNCLLGVPAEASLNDASELVPGHSDDDDAQISLWVLYELHYRSFSDVDDRWEWQPGIMQIRQRLEAVLESELRAQVATYVTDVAGHQGGLADRLFAMVEAFKAPKLSAYIQRRANLDQVREFLLHRSIYHLKEADPHTFVIPRLDGRAKAALVELQFDEYGCGRPERVHQTLFGQTLAVAGLDARYGAYVNDVPAATLTFSNALSLFSLHRRLRGAALGHLAAFEATSSLPCRRYAAGLRRVGLGDGALYFDEHIEADAVHEQLAMRAICEQLVSEDPSLESDVIFGAAACLTLDAHLSGDLIEAWESHRHLVAMPNCEQALFS